MAEQQHRRLDSGFTEEIPRNRSTSDFGVSSSGDLHQPHGGLGQKVPSSQHMSMGLNTNITDSGNMPMNRAGILGSHASLQDAEQTGGYQQGTGMNDYRLGSSNQLSSMARPQDSGEVLAGSLAGLDVSGSDNRYGVSGLRRNPKSFANLSHGTGLHIDDGIAPEVQARTLFIGGVTPELSDEELKADLQSFGDVQSLYTGLKQQGQILVTYYDCSQANQAYSLLNGRKLGSSQLFVEKQKSQKDASAGCVCLFNMENTANADIAQQMSSMFGAVLFVREHGQVAGCREVYFTDIRNAQKALIALYPQNAAPSTINEDSESASIDPTVGMQGNVQGTMLRPHQMQQQDQYASRNWAEQNMPRDRQRYSNQGRINSNPDVMALLNNSSQDTLDQLMRKGYLSQQHGSSNSLAGSMSGAQNFGSSSNLANPPLNYGSSANLKAQNFGSSNNLASSVGNYSSANLPSVANHGSSANLQAESDFGSSMNLKGSSNNLAGMPGMVNSASHGNLGHLSGGSLGDGLSQHFTPQQMAAYQNTLFGGPGALNKAKRSMTTNDLYSLAQASNQLGGLGGQFGSGQYDQAELSGWGGTPQQTDLDTASLLAQAQALDNLSGLGGLGGLQRSVSALHLQQLNQQAQQQQVLMQLAAYNPQVLSQLSNMRLQQNSAPLGFGRGKLPRGDENLGGGRLSRRAADPAVEAERRAQQDRHYALDAAKVERGEDSRTTLMIKNIPNKYTQKMLLQTIDEQFSRQYDFFYLPIDFKNKCNVGYAFINMVQPKFIVPFMARFNQRKWERFNSEKVCHISYARIQGKQQLVTHFQNSSLLHEDKRCRPILFKSDGDVASEQEPFPNAVSGLRANRARTANNEASQSSTNLSSASGSRDSIK